MTVTGWGVDPKKKKIYIYIFYLFKWIKSSCQSFSSFLVEPKDLELFVKCRTHFGVRKPLEFLDENCGRLMKAQHMGLGEV